MDFSVLTRTTSSKLPQDLRMILDEQQIDETPCDGDGCDLRACLVYASNLAPEELCQSCLECQRTGYGGWPKELKYVPTKVLPTGLREKMLDRCAARNTPFDHAAEWPDLPTGDEDHADAPTQNSCALPLGAKCASGHRISASPPLGSPSSLTSPDGSLAISKEAIEDHAKRAVSCALDGTLLTPLLKHCVQVTFAVHEKGVPAGRFKVIVKAYPMGSGKFSLNIRLELSSSHDVKKFGTSVPGRSSFVSDAVYGLAPDDKTLLSVIGSVHACIKTMAKVAAEEDLFSQLGKISTVPSEHPGVDTDSFVGDQQPPNHTTLQQPVSVEEAIQIVAAFRQASSGTKRSTLLGGIVITGFSGGFSQFSPSFCCPTRYDADNDGKRGCMAFLEALGATCTNDCKFRSSERKFALFDIALHRLCMSMIQPFYMIRTTCYWESSRTRQDSGSQFS